MHDLPSGERTARRLNDKAYSLKLLETDLKDSGRPGKIVREPPGVAILVDVHAMVDQAVRQADADIPGEAGYRRDLRIHDAPTIVAGGKRQVVDPEHLV